MRRTINLTRRERPLSLDDLLAYSQASLGRGESDLCLRVTEDQQRHIYGLLQDQVRREPPKVVGARMRWAGIKIERAT